MSPPCMLTLPPLTATPLNGAVQTNVHAYHTAPRKSSVQQPLCVSVGKLGPQAALSTGPSALAALCSLPRLEQGTPAELTIFAELVSSQIQDAIPLVQAEEPALGDHLLAALRLARAGRPCAALDKASEALAFAGLAAASSTAATSAGTSHGGGRRGYIPCGTGDCAGGATQAHVPANDSDLSDASAFKVPALPARLSGRSGSGGSGSSSPEPCWPSCAAGSGQGSPIRSACSDASDATSTAGAASPTETVSVMAADVQPQSPFAALLPAPAPVSQLVRRHAPPKRRPTPQVLPGAPAGVSSAAADSAAHGDAVCDEQLLSSWCPVSAKRARMTGSPPLPEQQQRGVLAGGCSSDSISSGVTAVLLPQHPPRQQHQQQQQQEGLSSPSCSSSSSTAAESAAQALQQLLHCGSGPLSGPAPDVLLFGDCTGQQPLRSWTGAIKHRGGGRAAELCHVTLQVPEPYSEELPPSLYAAEVRHRRSVSLGRHVVCRATLGTVREEQLAALAAMARGQLVALCRLQTAEIHVVPYFDNRNVVRVVGFLRVPA